MSSSVLTKATAKSKTHLPSLQTRSTTGEWVRLRGLAVRLTFVSTARGGSEQWCREDDLMANDNQTVPKDLQPVVSPPIRLIHGGVIRG